MGNDYHFLTEWRVPATVDEVKDVLGDAGSLTRWWPSVYLTVTEVEKGDERGLGRALELHTKGWLPYTLRWTLRITEPMSDSGFALEATGDLAGLPVETRVKLGGGTPSPTPSDVPQSPR